MKHSGSITGRTHLSRPQNRKRTRSDDWSRVLERSTPVSADILQGATKLLGRRSDRLGDIPSNPAELKRWIHRAQVEVSKATHHQHLVGIALAYALYARVKSLPDSGDLLEIWAKEISKKPTKRTDALHIIVASMISYGGNTVEDRARARRLHSRDVQAIRYLISVGLPPEAVAKKGAEEGEGLDAWARRYTASQKPKAPDARPKEQLSYIEWKRKTPEGTTVVVKRISLDHLTPPQQEDLLQMMEDYSKRRSSVSDSDE